jgi:hypothetical protein
VIAKPETAPASNPTKNDEQNTATPTTPRAAYPKTTTTEASGCFSQMSPGMEVAHGDIDSDCTIGRFISFEPRVLG